MKKVDMSSEAITRRLRKTDQLRELSLSLMKAKEVPDEKDEIEKQPKENSDSKIRDSRANSYK